MSVLEANRFVKEDEWKTVISTTMILVLCGYGELTVIGGVVRT